MIDWWSVASNALWIGGCVLALSTASYASWQASLMHRRWRDLLSDATPRRYLNLAAILFGLGFAATARSVWETGAWLLLTALFAVQLIRIRRAH